MKPVLFALLAVLLAGCGSTSPDLAPHEPFSVREFSHEGQRFLVFTGRSGISVVPIPSVRPLEK